MEYPRALLSWLRSDLYAQAVAEGWALAWFRRLDGGRFGRPSAREIEGLKAQQAQMDRDRQSLVAGVVEMWDRKQALAEDAAGVRIIED